MRRPPPYPRGLAYDPWKHAADLGLRVVERRLTGWRWGEFEHVRRVVYLDPRLLAIEARSVVAHEVVHAIHGDVYVGDEVADDALEARTRRLTALQLIDPIEYSAAACMNEDSTWWGLPRRLALGARLRVIPEVVDDFERIMRGTYDDTGRDRR